MSSNQTSIGTFSTEVNLSSNWLWASIQVWTWLFFSPERWHQYLEKSKLIYDFDLQTPCFRQWQKQGLWRLVVIGYVLSPLLSLALIALLFTTVDAESLEWLGLQIPHKQSLGFILTASLGFAWIAGLALGLLLSVALGIISTSLLLIPSALMFATVGFNPLIIILFGLILGIIANIHNTLTMQAQPWANKISDMVSSLVFGLIIAFVVIGIPLELASEASSGTVLTALGLLSTIILIWALKVPAARILLIILVLACLPFVTEESLYGGVSRGLVYGLLTACCLVLPYLLLPIIGQNTTQSSDHISIIAGVFLSSGVWAFVLGAKDRWADVTGFDLTGYILLASGFAFIGLLLSKWRPWLERPCLFVYHSILFSFDQHLKTTQKPWLRYHAAFWYQHYPWRFFLLEEHFLLIIAKNPKWAKAALDYLETACKGQHTQAWVVTAVWQALELKQLEGIEDLQSLKPIKKPSIQALKLQEIANEFKQIKTIKDNDNQIIELDNLCNVMNQLILDWAGKTQNNSYTKIAKKWLKWIHEDKQQLQQQRLDRDDIINPYMPQRPLNQGHSTFKGRKNLVRQLEVILFQQHESVFLYGQHRIGKTSLIHNLSRLLNDADKYCVVFVDLQKCIAQAQNLIDFFVFLAEDIKDELSQKYYLSVLNLIVDEHGNPKQAFEHWLNGVQKQLDKLHLILVLDEFLMLDSAIQQQEKGLDQDILSIFRNWIQHRPQFSLLIMSQRLKEFQRWPALTNNMQALHVGYLTSAEAKELICQPIADFPLKYDSDAVDYLINQSSGHPALLQALCSQIIQFKNQQDLAQRFQVCLSELQAHDKLLLEASSAVFNIFIARLSLHYDGALPCLIYIAKQAQAVTFSQLQQAEFTDLDTKLEALLNLELITEITTEQYQISIPWAKRYFASYDPNDA